MKKVLFVCIENSCRSQMAEGFAKVLGEGLLEIYSAGSKPPGVINPSAIEVMREAGFDISSQSSKGFSDLAIKTFDYVITLGCGDKCPIVPAAARIDWQIPDPKGYGIDVFRKVREEIRKKVEALIKEVEK